MLHQLKSQITASDLLTGFFGIEREALRVNLDGTLALTPHPPAFSNKEANPYITTDFSESQIEMVTPVQTTLREAHQCLTMLYQLVVSELDNEQLWPGSMPCGLKAGQEIPLAVFSESEKGRLATAYRQYLAKKYGKERQLISGIHYNFSLSVSLIDKLYQNAAPKTDRLTFKNQIYLKIARNYLRYRWLLIYFLGASPTNGEISDAISLRNTREAGYQNEETLDLDYTSTSAYVKSINQYIEAGKLISHQELYCSVRLKAQNSGQILDSLLKEGIEYLEIRSIDLDPFTKEGISLTNLKFVHLFMLFLLAEEELGNENWQQESHQNAQYVAVNKQTLIKNGSPIKRQDWALMVLDKIKQLNDLFNLEMDSIIEEKRQQIFDPSLTLAARFMKEIKEKGYVEAHMELANQYEQAAKLHPYATPGFEDLELSTQILMAAAIKQGISIKILDRQENFLQLQRGNQAQLVKQATKTALDSYVSVLAMENKEVTKQILKQSGIVVPKGALFRSYEAALQSFADFKGKSIVIKPKSTNFGEGITIFKDLKGKRLFGSALKTAFSYGDSVIVEKLQRGEEYRFLIVGEQLIGILKRIPANVIGDSLHTIKQLVDIKNQNPWRQTGYRSPLEKINIDEQVSYYLNIQGYTEHSIIPEGKQVFLRENSNISTGGDSLDMTDQVPDHFKKQAILAAKQMGATICGVDMIIEDIKNPDSSYAIIELNFNPAIHIHAYPYQGKSRNAAPYILQALGFK